VPDVSIQSALGVLLNYNGLTNRFIEGSPTYITEGISDSSITSNGINRRNEEITEGNVGDGK
jgi:hypothetical protein